jgi:uncharacterized protein YqhQ
MQKMEKKLSLGGQAVIEGVMMKSEHHLCVAVRKKNKKIVFHEEKVKQPKHKFLKRISTLPFVRGIYNLFSILVIGIRTLLWSASQFVEEEGEELTGKDIFLMLTLSIGFAVGLFVIVPYFFTGFIGISEVNHPVVFNVVDGIFKIILFIAYVYIISLFPDIKRIFEYHGAEHKAVYCYEKSLPLTVKNAQKFSTKHPRCGTSFLVIVLLVSIFIFVLVPLGIILAYPSFQQIHTLIQKIILLPIRILLIPVIAGISYELLKLGAKYEHNLFMKILILPGILVQHITTKEPNTKQMEVAIASLNHVLRKEKK